VFSQAIYWYPDPSDAPGLFTKIPMNYFRIQKIEFKILAKEVKELQREMKKKATRGIQVKDL
jgi:hypothetical protein